MASKNVNPEDRVVKIRKTVSQVFEKAISAMLADESEDPPYGELTYDMVEYFFAHALEKLGEAGMIQDPVSGWFYEYSQEILEKRMITDAD